MNSNELREKAERLRALHAGPRILVLCNAWDAASARIVEEAGFPAVATTSAGIANSLGYPDGQRVSREEMAEAVARVARAVAVPVSADMESGYGLTPEAAAETARAAIAAGAVGMNLEDAIEEREFIDIRLQADRVRAAREAGEHAGVPLVINARTDVYLSGIGTPAEQFEQAVRRANAYREAGADLIFVDGIRTMNDLRDYAAKLKDLPLLYNGQLLPVAELAKRGFRLTIHSGTFLAYYQSARDVLTELKQTGSVKTNAQDTAFGELVDLLGVEEMDALGRKYTG